MRTKQWQLGIVQHVPELFSMFQNYSACSRVYLYFFFIIVFKAEFIPTVVLMEDSGVGTQSMQGL